MADEPEQPHETVTSKADAMALLEQAEAEAAEAEAVAAAARARARAARLRREALAFTEAAEDYGDAAAAAADVDAGGYYPATATDEHDQAAAEDYDDNDDNDDEGDEQADYEADDEPAYEATRRKRLLTLLSIVAAVLVVAAFTAATAYMLVQHRDTTQDDKRQALFIAGAKQSVLNMISLDFNKAKDDFQRMLDSSTGQFKDDFQQHANEFISVVENSKAVTEGTINAAAVESTDTDAAVVLVSATSRVTNSPPGKEEPPKTWRLRVTITDVGGHYKLSKVEYVT